MHEQDRECQIYKAVFRNVEASASYKHEVWTIPLNFANPKSGDLLNLSIPYVFLFNDTDVTNICLANDPFSEI